MSKESVIGKCLLLKQLKKSDMTQVELSELTGISRQQINEYIKNNRIMSLPNARIIASTLSCHIDDLYEWKI